MCILDEGYSRRASCALNLLSKFLLLNTNVDLTEYYQSRQLKLRLVWQNTAKYLNKYYMYLRSDRFDWMLLNLKSDLRLYSVRSTFVFSQIYVCIQLDLRLYSVRSTFVFSQIYVCIQSDLRLYSVRSTFVFS
jgi:hypothetical protein